MQTAQQLVDAVVRTMHHDGEEALSLRELEGRARDLGALLDVSKPGSDQHQIAAVLQQQVKRAAARQRAGMFHL